MTKAEQLFETAKQLMALQAAFAQQITALENDEATPPHVAHMLIDEAIDLASGLFADMKANNKKYLEERVEKDVHVCPALYIAGVQVTGKTYTPKPVKGFEILNKEDPTVWAAIIKAAAETVPDVIQKRITDSKVNEAFLTACAGLIAVKTGDDYTWSVTNIKESKTKK